MVSKRQIWMALAIAPMLVAFLATPTVSRAADKHVKCEVTKDGKTETKQVKTADECTKMGGKVVPKEPKGEEKK